MCKAWFNFFIYYPYSFFIFSFPLQCKRGKVTWNTSTRYCIRNFQGIITIPIELPLTYCSTGLKTCLYLNNLTEVYCWHRGTGGRNMLFSVLPTYWCWSIKTFYVNPFPHYYWRRVASKNQEMLFHFLFYFQGLKYVD